MGLENLVLKHSFGESPRYTLSLAKDKEVQNGDVVSSVFHRRSSDKSHALVFYVLSRGGKRGYSLNFCTWDKSIGLKFGHMRIGRGTQVSWERVMDEGLVKKIKDTAKEILPLYYSPSLGDYMPHKKGFLSLEAYLKALS